ncbi:hypothetical protein P378_09645 [Desulforamulus profundi]|uniref:Uncharacterized protein n=1 Tax=Desulforamulus profundi TaxID=1383067 RepID=A0A2C6MGC5_9FIRM|nr:hypothetical protein P378_09645 [Desulforamulus profundi]
MNKELIKFWTALVWKVFIWKMNRDCLQKTFCANE